MAGFKYPAGMPSADLSAPPRTRIGVFVAVAALHVVAVLFLLRAFAPDFTRAAVEKAVDGFSVTVTAPPPTAEPQVRPKPAGASASAGQRAVPREVAAAKPKVVLAKTLAPVVANSGAANSAGAAIRGAGTAAGGTGSGTGSGAGGSGTGGGAVTMPVKISGDIAAARDYPRAGKAARLGDFVVVTMTVGVDGRAHDCRVQRASRDAAADALTCRFAVERFRFKPATDASGRPVEARYGWRQRWFE